MVEEGIRSMTATGHAVIGTVIAAKIGNPALAIPIAFASHFVADMIPHWDTATNSRKKTRKKIFIESGIDVMISYIVSFVLVSFFFPQTSLSYAYLMVFMAQLPDWLMAPYYFFRIKFPLCIYAYRIQKNIFDHKLDKPWGIINQVVAVSLTVLVGKLL